MIYRQSRKAHRADGNHEAILKAWVSFGGNVIDTHCHGPLDAILKKPEKKMSVFIEIKDGIRPQSQKKLTYNEKEFIGTFFDCSFVVESIEQLIQIWEDEDLWN